jgi:hypothetical protein
MHWLSVAGTVLIGLCCVWLLLLTFRVIGKPRGQDPKYDASMEYWSGTFRVMGFIGIVAVALEAAALIMEAF